MKLKIFLIALNLLTVTSMYAMRNNYERAIEVKDEEIQMLMDTNVELHEMYKSVTTDEIDCTKQAEPSKRYELTDDERDLIERVVTAEAASQPMDGMMLVAQCILNTAEADNYSIQRVINSYGYAKPAGKSTQNAIDAVSAVFDDGYQVTDEPVIYFYNPAAVKSTFHESQVFVIEIGDHKFFKRK